MDELLPLALSKALGDVILGTQLLQGLCLVRGCSRLLLVTWYEVTEHSLCFPVSSPDGRVLGHRVLVRTETSWAVYFQLLSAMTDDEVMLCCSCLI